MIDSRKTSIAPILMHKDWNDGSINESHELNSITSQMKLIVRAMSHFYIELADSVLKVSKQSEQSATVSKHYSFIHSFIHSFIPSMYIAPLRGTAPNRPRPSPRLKKKDLRDF